jgi:hypothetical protein
VDELEADPVVGLDVLSERELGFAVVLCELADSLFDSDFCETDWMLVRVFHEDVDVAAFSEAGDGCECEGERELESWQLQGSSVAVMA